MQLINVNRRRILFVWLALSALFFLPGASFASVDYNVVIICLDTLRADHLSCYGYSRETTPNIDRLMAAQGILFEWAISQSNLSQYSHAALFTSEYVFKHKHNFVHITDRGRRFSVNDEITLAEVLRDNGYKTAAFIYNQPHLSPEYGLNKGFDKYNFGIDTKRPKVSFKKTVPQALSWIKKHRKNKFFVFLHSFDIHSPFCSPYEHFFDPHYKEPSNIEFRSSTQDHSFCRHHPVVEMLTQEHIIAHYDGGIKYADVFVGKFLRQLKHWGLLDRTIVILLSDHGETMGEHGNVPFYHGLTMYDEELHVPLIIMHPGLEYRGVRIASQVQLINVMPTVLDFLGIKRGQMKIDGRSLVDLIKGKTNGDFDKYAYAESCMRDDETEKSVIYYPLMVRKSSYKLICSFWGIENDPQKGVSRDDVTKYPFTRMLVDSDREQIASYELYDLKGDPRERENLIGQGHNEIEAELLNQIISNF